MKNIDADKLKAEITRLEEMDYPCDTLEQSTGFYDALDRIKSFIDSLQQEQPDDLVSLISEATNVAKRIADWDSFYNSLPQNLRNKYTSNAWREILEALSTMKEPESPEVDLEKEILDWIGDEGSCKNGKWTWYECNKMIRHFYELGLNTRKV